MRHDAEEKFYARVTADRGLSWVELPDATCVCMFVDGEQYELATDNFGQPQLRSAGDRLVLLPEASNLVALVAQTDYRRELLGKIVERREMPDREATIALLEKAQEVTGHARAVLIRRALEKLKQ